MDLNAVALHEQYGNPFGGIMCVHNCNRVFRALKAMVEAELDIPLMNYVDTSAPLFRTRFFEPSRCWDGSSN